MGGLETATAAIEQPSPPLMIFGPGAALSVPGDGPGGHTVPAKVDDGAEALRQRS